MEKVPRRTVARTPCVPLFSTLFNRGGNKERFRLPGAGGGSFPLYGGTFAQSYSVSKKVATFMAKRLAAARSTVIITLHKFIVLGLIIELLGSGQEVCFSLSRPDPVRNAREQDGTRTGRDGPHLGTWMGPKHCKTKHMANLDGTTSDPGWDLDGPRMGPRRGSGWHPPETVTDF